MGVEDCGTSPAGWSRRCWPRRAGREGPTAPDGASRKGEREPGKSDQIDALAVARAVVKDGVEQFPVAYLNEQAMEIRLLLDHRGDLVAERTRTVNRLRWHLLELCPELEHSLKRGALNQARVLDRLDRRLRKLPRSRGSGSRASRSPICAPSTAKSTRCNAGWWSLSRFTARSCSQSLGAAR